MQDYLPPRHNLRVGLATAEQLRVDIGMRRAARPRALDRGSRCRRHDRPAATIRLVERRIARGACAPLDDILDAIKTTLDGCSPDLAADLVDHGITVCGGGVLRQFDVLLAERIGLPARILPAARSIVATGMLTLLEDLSRWQPMLQSSDDDV